MSTTPFRVGISCLICPWSTSSVLLLHLNLQQHVLFSVLILPYFDKLSVSVEDSTVTLNYVSLITKRL